MIICLAGTKGGSGRSTTATNFACIAAGQGMKVLMVDADDQETSADFTAARNRIIRMRRALPVSSSRAAPCDRGAGPCPAI